LDEPFTGLSHEQALKLVKIVRQKVDCTLIVTAKSKAAIEMLQPHQVLTIQPKEF
jgi:ABC-type multidrug transport system ATPase subunit